MAKRQRDWAHRAKAALIAQLGGCCALCQTTWDLEIDHIHGRDWHPRQHELSWRISIYRREAAAGLLRVLCSHCNGSDGARRRRA
jgi:5-methylcytosine-specific restriction endonuclease McrA